MILPVIEVNHILLSIPFYLNQTLGLFLWFVGMVGCFGNVIVFRDPSFRHRAYSIYLFWASICDFFYFNFVLMAQILQQGFQIPLMNRFTIVCKVRQFCAIWGNNVSFTLFAFATIDRLLSAQRSIRK